MGDSCGGGCVFWCRTKLISDEAGLRAVSASADSGPEQSPLSARRGGASSPAAGRGLGAWPTCLAWTLASQRRVSVKEASRAGTCPLWSKGAPGAVSQEEEGGFMGKSPASFVRSRYPAELSTSCFPEVSSSPNAWCWAQSWRGFLRSSFSVHPAFPHPDSILLAYFFQKMYVTCYLLLGSTANCVSLKAHDGSLLNHGLRVSSFRGRERAGF